MKIDRISIALASLAGVLLVAAPALAEDPSASSPGTGQERAEFCKENPEKCQEARARRQAFCKDNPEKCEQMKQKRAERREFCKANPEKCEEQRARRKERRAEFQAKCAAEPDKCEQMKQERRERFQKRHGVAKPPSGGVKAPSDSAPQPPE